MEKIYIDIYVYIKTRNLNHISSINNRIGVTTDVSNEISLPVLSLLKHLCMPPQTSDHVTTSPCPLVTYGQIKFSYHC